MLMVVAIPKLMPANAVQSNVHKALLKEKTPVKTAATANLKHTKPEASLNRDSPSRICNARLGIGIRAAIPDTATGSVGDKIAASANATPKGMLGISQ